MKFTREEYLDLMTFGGGTRPMFVELFGLMVGVEEEWRQQGATDDEVNLLAFDWDYVPVVQCGGNTNIFGGAEILTLEETAEHLVQRDALGRKTKLYKNVATIALPLEYPVSDMDSWRKVKHLFTFDPGRVDSDAVRKAKAAQAQGALVVASIPGGFDIPRDLMGEEMACTGFYDQPELLHDIIDTLKDTSMKVLERVTDEVVIDQLSVHEDLAGKPGPLIGPRQFNEFIRPYFREVWDLVSSRGTRIFDMDSDGNVIPLLDELLDCGLNSMHPMEPAAGMDIVALRKKYGKRLAMRGGINKHTLREGEEAIRKELEYKMPSLMLNGGIAFGLDHRIPNGTPLESYRYYVTLGRELLGLPPRSDSSMGWQRMAF
jgi:uroporphyrinogen-III decarboxylase